MRELGLKFRYWQTYYRHLTKNSTSPVTLYKCAQNAGITHSIKTTQEITSEISKLRTDIREMKQNHQELRREMLQELAEEYTAKNNKRATEVIKEIIATEQLKKNYRNIRYALGKQRNSSIL